MAEVVDQLAVSPIGAMITMARNRASKKSGNPIIIQSEVCTCEVELAYFTPTSTRERYSRCVMHALKK